MGMKVILRNGKELPVDTSKLTEKDTYWNTDYGIVIDDELKLWDAWVATAYKHSEFTRQSEPEMRDFVAEKMFFHEPTDNELINFMVSFGVGRYGFVEINKVKVLAYPSEDDENKPEVI